MVIFHRGRRKRNSCLCSKTKPKRKKKLKPGRTISLIYSSPDYTFLFFSLNKRNYVNRYMTINIEASYYEKSLRKKILFVFSFLEKDLSNSSSRLFLFSSSSLVRLDKKPKQTKNKMKRHR